MTVLHLIAAVIAVIAAVLYADRTFWLTRNGQQDSVWALANRAAWFFVPVVLAAGFTQLAFQHQPFAARHAFVTGVLLVVCVTHVGLRGKSPT